MSTKRRKNKLNENLAKTHNFGEKHVGDLYRFVLTPLRVYAFFKGSSEADQNFFLSRFGRIRVFHLVSEVDIGFLEKSLENTSLGGIGWEF